MHSNNAKNKATNIMINIKFILKSIAILLVFVIATGSAWLYSRINSALPQLDGKATLFGLEETTVVERDENGIATIKANNRNDAAMALGFVHAQERFFQMDLLRRNSAGELSSLFGEIAIERDKEIRIHRFRERARAMVEKLAQTELAMLKAYTRGVNQGLSRLRVSPFEYNLLRQTPVEWREEDTVLAVYSMYLDLQYADGSRELSLDVMNKALPPEWFAFFNPKGSRWDAAIDGTSYAPSPLPTELPEGLSAHSSSAYIPLENPDFYGSNNWAVAGEISSTGSAIVANDMHLGIRVPNTWYRASIEYQQDGETVKITGATLPGTPNVVVGSNGNIAWGFTNSYGDWSDVIVLKTNEDQSQYLTPEGFVAFDMRNQIIAVKGQEAIEFQVQDTIWGPVIGKNAGGELLAYRWVAHDENAVNLSHTKLETAKTVEQAFEIAASSGIPAQNMMVGDKQGNIGWTIMGPIPRKVGNIGELPSDWSTGENTWDGYLTAEEYPKVYAPKDNRLWTGNSRVVGEALYEHIGNGGYALGARSQQIQQRLFEQDRFSEKELLKIALDTEAIFLKRWQQLLLSQVLTEQALKDKAEWHEVKAFVDVPTLYANVDSVGYRIVKNFRAAVKDKVFEQLNSYLTAYDENFDPKTIRSQMEVPLWQLIQSQPNEFLPNGGSWHEVFVKSLQTALTDMTEDQTLEEATWGQENAAKINHPLSSAIPIFGQYLNMPTDPLPGDTFMPRVDGAGFGASERMIVSPGHEESGIFHMPTSQAGHPWSPYFGKGHSDWVEGRPSPFLPGETKYKLTLLSY